MSDDQSNHGIYVSELEAENATLRAIAKCHEDDMARITTLTAERDRYKAALEGLLVRYSEDTGGQWDDYPEARAARAALEEKP